MCKLIIFAKTTIRGLNTKAYLPGKLSADRYLHVLPNQSYSTWLSTCKITLVFDAWVLFQHNQSECVHSLVTVTIVTISSIITNAWDVQPFCLWPPLIFYDALRRSRSDQWRVTYVKWQVTQYDSAFYIRQMLIKRCSLIVAFDWMRYCVCFLSTQDCKKSCCGQILTPRQEVNCGNFRLSTGNNMNHVLTSNSDHFNQCVPVAVIRKH